MFSILIDRARRLFHQYAFRQSMGLLLVFTTATLTGWIITYLLVTHELNDLIERRLGEGATEAIAILDQSERLPAPSLGQVLMLINKDEPQQGYGLPQIALERAPLGYSRYDAGAHDDPDWYLLVSETRHGRLIVGENVDRNEETISILVGGLQFSIGFSVLAAVLVSLWAARRNQLRFNKINHSLARIASGQLGERISLDGPKDDLVDLAHQINATAEQLETLMSRMKVQASNIAHDLRTPLARLRALIEEQYLALSNDNEPPDEEALALALMQIDRLVETFNALLRISRIESGARKSDFVSLDLGTLVEEVQEIFTPVVEEKGQKLNVYTSDPATIRGDRELLIQMLGNLIQNALRYGAQRQIISLSVEDTLLSIADQGPGIPEEEYKNVLEPLYQIDNERQDEGYGLGLAMVCAIADLHDAMLELDEGPNALGLCVNLKFSRFTKM